MIIKNLDFSKNQQLEKEYEDKIADRYNRDYHEPPIMNEHSRRFVDYLSRAIKPGDRVLDLACASASLWGHFKKLLPENITLVGVDLSPKMLEEARKQFPQGDFREGSFTKIPSGAGEFDVVIVSSAFHHINDKLLPDSLMEISRVMDEHGILLGREPLLTGRLVDRGGWFSGLLMNVRHFIYHKTHTREYPEPDPGIDHHAYIALDFLNIINSKLTVENIQFSAPFSPVLGRVNNRDIATIAKYIDDSIDHREGQEIYYTARKNFVSSAQLLDCVQKTLNENKISKEELNQLSTRIAAAALVIEKIISK
jgi:ubiquinone/menaquinone biosynthesis C-methylase UbiE